MASVRSTLANIPLIARVGVLYAVVAFCVGGVALLMPRQHIVYATTTPPALEQQAVEVAQSKPDIIGVPVHITLPRVGIDLDVKPGYYDEASRTWTLSNTEAFYATVSHKAGTQPGTTFIYGHNRASAFARLSKIQEADTAVITLEDGTRLTYVYARDVRVTPESTQIMYEKSDYPQLVLMTCEGLLSDARRVIYFTLQGAQ